MTLAISNKIGKYYHELRPVPHKLHPTLEFLFDEMRFSRVSVTELARVAGLADCVVSAWRRGINPRLNNLEAALNTMGYTLAAVPLPKERT